MTYADAGAGKSIISLCACLQASAGLPVFGFFEPVRPLKIYYALGERDISEPAERMQLINKSFDFNYENIFIDDETVGIDLLSQTDELKFIKRIETYCPNPDIIVIDPIYCMIRGDLSNPSQATEFAKASNRIQKHFKCSMWLNNHTVKHTSEIVNGKRFVKKDPFFGSQMLKAHITLSYHLCQENNIVTFYRYKDSHEVGLKEFCLAFDHETYTLLYTSDKISTISKAELFVLKMKKSDKSFTYDDFHAAISPVTPRYSQKIMGVTIAKFGIKNVSAKFEKALYKFM